GVENRFENSDRLLAGDPFLLAAQEVLLRDHFEDRPDVLRHPAVDENQALLQMFADTIWGVALVEDFVRRQQPAPADSKFRVARLRLGSSNESHAGPDPAGILPSASGPPDPFAENRAGRDEPAFFFAQWAGEALGLSGRAHARGDEGAEQVRRNRQPR